MEGNPVSDRALPIAPAKAQARTAFAACDALSVPLEQPVVALEDRGLQFGEAAYEGLLVRDGRIFAWEAHLARLEASARGVGIAWSAALVERVLGTLEALFGEAKLGAPEAFKGEAFVYLQVNAGVAPRDHVARAGIEAPRVLASWRPLDAGFRRRRSASGVATILRPDPRWSGARFKSCQLLGNVLAKREAQALDAEECLFVDADGFLVEGGATNLFVVLGGVAVTPPRQRNLLAGVTRNELLRAFPGRTAEADVRVEWLEQAEEVFVTSTTKGILPVTAVDGRPVGDGRPGRKSLALASDFERHLDEAFAASVPFRARR